MRNKNIAIILIVIALLVLISGVVGFSMGGNSSSSIGFQKIASEHDYGGYSFVGFAAVQFKNTKENVVYLNAINKTDSTQDFQRVRIALIDKDKKTIKEVDGVIESLPAESSTQLVFRTYDDLSSVYDYKILSIVPEENSEIPE